MGLRLEKPHEEIPHLGLGQEGTGALALQERPLQPSAAISFMGFALGSPGAEEHS